MQAVSYNTFCLKRSQLMMDPSTLPSSFDVVVVGTGLEESIVAAAASRVGHSVLHVDPNDFYGDSWAAFSFEGIQQWVEKRQSVGEEDQDVELTEERRNVVLRDDESLVALKRQSLFRNVEQKFHIPEEEKKAESEEKRLPEEKVDEEKVDVGEVEAQEEAKGVGEDKVNEETYEDKATTRTATVEQEGQPKWTKTKLLENSRRFNLDLTPRLLFSRGPMVELLISSNIARYTEFKSVSRVLTVVKDGTGSRLEHVPSSRADVFATRSVSVVEKRILMKFLTLCASASEEDDPEVASFAERPFTDFLRHHKLTPNLSHFVTRSIAMVPPDATTRRALSATRRFLDSLGRFGNTPFLWSMYGAGELPQAFCRLCAVFGGTYFLGRPVEAVAVEEKERKATAVITGGTRIEFKKLVLPAAVCPPELKATRKAGAVFRRLRLLANSVMPSEKEQLSFVSFPSGSSYAYVQEVGFGAAACPRGMYCLQVTSGDPSARDSVSETVDNLTEHTSPLWDLSYEMDVLEEKEEGGSGGIENVFSCSGPSFELDYDAAISNARAVFQRMFPGEEFLPRAPEPEEIIIGGEEEEEEEDAPGNAAADVAAEREEVEKEETSKNDTDRGDGAATGSL